MTERFVEVSGGRLFVETTGSGPALVFLHPGLWDSRTWDDQIGAFSEVFRCVRLDLRGYGRSSRPEPGAPYSHVDDVVAVMDAVGVGAAALIGCSMGGRIAIDVALTQPRRVTALVLAAPSVGGFRETEDEAAEYTELDRTIEEATAAGDAERAMELELSVWATRLGTDDPAGARIRQIAFDNLHVVAMDESEAAQLDPPAFDRLAEIEAPTLVLPADQDPPVMLRLCREVTQRIPNARLVQIPDTDHVINMRQPVEFNRVILGFLDEVLGS